MTIKINIERIVSELVTFFFFFSIKKNKIKIKNTIFILISSIYIFQLPICLRIFMKKELMLDKLVMRFTPYIYIYILAVKSPKRKDTTIEEMISRYIRTLSLSFSKKRKFHSFPN